MSTPQIIEAMHVLALSSQNGVPTLVAALVARLKCDGKDEAAKKVVALAGELAKEYGRTSREAT